MGEPARKIATWQDVLNAPDHLVAEVINGQLHTSPRPAPKHAAAASGIMIDVGQFGRGRRSGDPRSGWLILAEPELHLGNDIVVPDVAGWRRERMPELPREAYFSVAPDWVCEVISPRTARLDRTQKKRVYARNRVEWFWLVDPLARTLEVLKLSGEFWQEVQVFAGNERIQPLPFEGLEVDLALWWEGMGEDEADLPE